MFLTQNIDESFYAQLYKKNPNGFKSSDCTSQGKIRICRYQSPRQTFYSEIARASAIRFIVGMAN